MFCSASSPENRLKVTHLEKIPVKFTLDKKTQNFHIKFNKLNNENAYEKIEFDFENELILIQNLNDSTIFSLNFPLEFKQRKSSLINENFNWDTTTSQIIISYKNPPQVIVIDENSETMKNKIITIEDNTEEMMPRSRGIRVINDLNEIQSSINFRSMDKESKKYFDRRLKIVMRNVEKEFTYPIVLKKSQIKKLAELLIEKDFDSYQKAMENGYNYDISANILSKNPNETNKNIDESEFNEIKGFNNYNQALNDIEEAEKNEKAYPNKKKSSSSNDIVRRKNEKQWNIYYEQHGADEKDLNFEDEKEFEDYEIKKKNNVYILNENKFKSLFSRPNENFQKFQKFQKKNNKIHGPEEEEQKKSNAFKRKRNVFISDDEVFL